MHVIGHRVDVPGKAHKSGKRRRGIRKKRNSSVRASDSTSACETRPHVPSSRHHAVGGHGGVTPAFSSHRGAYIRRASVGEKAESASVATTATSATHRSIVTVMKRPSSPRDHQSVGSR